MTRVNTGVAWEYKIRDYFLAKGYEVVRAAGSKGAVDLVMFNTQETVLIQAKKESRKLNYLDDELRLRDFSAPSHVRKQLWIKNKAKITVIELGESESENEIRTMHRKDMKAVILGD